MFGKEPKDRSQEGGAVVTPEKEMRDSGVGTLFGKGTKFNGRFEADGGVQIDGGFEGEILVRGTLMVGKEGKVNAKVSANRVVVHGLLEGDVNATSKVELMEGATLLGNVSSPSMVIQDEVHFEGTCRVGRKDTASAPTPKEPVKT